MKYTIMDSKQENLLKFNLDLIDIIIIRYFIDLVETKKLKVKTIDGKFYYWVRYDEVIREFPIFNIKKCTVQARFFKLRDAGVLTHKVVRDGGTYSYFGIGKKYAELIEEDINAKSESSIEVKVEAEIQAIEKAYGKNTVLKSIEEKLQGEDKKSQDVYEAIDKDIDNNFYNGTDKNSYSVDENLQGVERYFRACQFKSTTKDPSTKYLNIKNIKKWFSFRKRFLRLGDGDMQEVLKIEDILEIEREDERVSALYNIFNESSRLSTKATQVEFLTTVRQIEKHLKPGMKILDLGAGTGEYSLYFARKGFEVTAIELVEKHVMQIREKIDSQMSLEVYQGNAMDISMIKDKDYDIVLCFGPLYHLAKVEYRMKCIAEVKRVCKDNGKMFFAFISNDMVITTETMRYDTEFLKGDTYNHESFKLVDFPFVFHTVDDCRKLLRDSDLTINSEVAADGLSELLADKINNMDDESYKSWLNYHYYCCEKPEFLGTSNHLLFIAEK